MRIHRLSKSRFMAGLHCARRLWLLVNRPEFRREPTLAEARRMEFGSHFGREVTRLFPGGVEVTADYLHPQEAIDATAALQRDGVPVLFEAAFLHRGVLIRADILRRSDANPEAWELIEVKSDTNGEASKKAKVGKHIHDMAIQAYVLEGAGIAIESMRLARVNAAYERQGELDWRELVVIEDHTDAVRLRVANIEHDVTHFLRLIDHGDMPEATYGKTKCAECEFSAVCWADEPEDSIIHLPRLGEAKLTDLRAIGVERISQIPDDFELSPTQRSVRDVFRHPDGLVAAPKKLEQWIETLEYPIYYFDFETWNPCVPPFDGTKPYQQIPFQYSVHVQPAPGAKPMHREFLASGLGDPRPELIERMLVDLGDEGSIVVHHAKFESDRIEELARYSPTHQERLLALLDRIRDTEVPFMKSWYVHPGLMGRSSIKVVLPTLVPELSYAGMEIADGETASITFGDMFEGRVPAEGIEACRIALLEYCRRDTLAMVEIVERLWGMVGR